MCSPMPGVDGSSVPQKPKALDTRDLLASVTGLPTVEPVFFTL